MSIPRLIPDWPFPKYIFVPGINPHPKKSGGHMEGEGDPVAPPIDHKLPQENKFLRYSLDLYNHGYFWESHVYFEALWNAHQRAGSTADFLKGMIKLGAAGVKMAIDQKAAAMGHLERGKELFMLVRTQEGKSFLGFDLDQIIIEIEQAIKSQNVPKNVFPEWS